MWWFTAQGWQVKPIPHSWDEVWTCPNCLSGPCVEREEPAVSLDVALELARAESAKQDEDRKAQTLARREARKGTAA